jgi:UDP-glucose 4-epimerase
MKILIIGKNSYIAKKLEKFLLMKNHLVNLISLRFDYKDEEIDLGGVDIVIHLSALVHKNKRKLKYDDYYNANVVLPLRIAKISEEKKIKHFIFMSSMAVFGNKKKIDINSTPSPVTFYGKSKYEAEVKLEKLLHKNLTELSIIRSPVVFGKDAPGNPKLLNIISRYSFGHPRKKNNKSIIYIDSLFTHF